MTMPGAWICRSCWNTNRPGDRRCYRCHTPRTADDLPIQGARPGDVAPRAIDDPGAVIGIMVALPSIVFRWISRIYLLGGVVFLGITVLIVINPRAPELAWLLAAGAAGAMFVLAFATRWASSAMRDRNPWAFAVALVLSIGIAGLSLYALNTFPAGTGNPNPMRYATIVIGGLTAIFAAVGLLLSLASGDDVQANR